jgi:hypothetical protein
MMWRRRLATLTQRVWWRTLASLSDNDHETRDQTLSHRLPSFLPAGYVDWRTLLQAIAEELELDVALETDFVAMAQFHYNYSGKQRARLHKTILEGLSANAKSTANHDLLVQLPIDTYWTTNYDKLIETSLADFGKVVDVKCTVPQMTFTRPFGT